MKTLDQELFMLEYLDKMPNDAWFLFLNLATNERLFTTNKEHLRESITNDRPKLIMVYNSLLCIHLVNLLYELLEYSPMESPQT